jgi:hypothetical protein
MPRHPIDGMKGSKPRLSGTDGKPASKAAIAKLSAQYLEARNAKLRAQAFMAEAQAKEKAGELIGKELASRQIAYVIVAFRQRMLNLSHSWARRFIGLADMHEAKRLIDEMARSTLIELTQLPKCIEPDWLERLEADEQGQEGGKPPRPASGQEVKAEQEKAKRRREKKTQMMRKLRAQRRTA